MTNAPSQEPATAADHPGVTPTVAVTGSTGVVGGQVARHLAAAGVAQLLLVRDASRAPDLPRTAVAVADYDDADANHAALAGIVTLFMVSASENEHRLAQHLAMVDAAVAAGVDHIIYLSFYGAAPDCTFTLGRDHWATEEHIRESGAGFTFLRDNFYMDYLAYFAGDAGVIRGPAGDGRVSSVAQADVAAVAARVLQDPATYRGRTLNLTGGQALTATEIAAELTTALGRPVRFENETIDEAYASRASYGAPSWQLDA